MINHDGLRTLIAEGRGHNAVATPAPWEVKKWKPSSVRSRVDGVVASHCGDDDAAAIAWLRTHLAPLLDALEQLVERVPVCAHCERQPASCFGAYESVEPVPACDECCGHANEDGWCLPIVDLPGWAAVIGLNISAVADERDRLRAEVARLEALLEQRQDGARAGQDGDAMNGTELLARLLDQRRHASHAIQLAALAFAARFNRGGRRVGPELMHLEAVALQVADADRALQAGHESQAAAPAPARPDVQTAERPDVRTAAPTRRGGAQ